MERVGRYCGAVLSLGCLRASAVWMERSWSRGGWRSVAVYALFVLSNWAYAQLLIAEGRARERAKRDGE